MAGSRPSGGPAMTLREYRPQEEKRECALKGRLLGRRTLHRLPGLAARKPGLDGVPDVPFQGDLVEAVDLLDPGGRGDVDLGQIVADHVDADEDEPALLQGRTDGGADLAFAVAE